MHQDRSWEVPVAVYVCVSRGNAMTCPVENDSHRNFEGGVWRWDKSHYAGNSMLMPQLPAAPLRRIERLASITDGLSKAILAGEKAIDPLVQTRSSWYWDEPLFVGGSGSMARRGLALMRDAVGDDYKTHRGAAHPGIAVGGKRIAGTGMSSRPGVVCQS